MKLVGISPSTSEFRMYLRANEFGGHTGPAYRLTATKTHLIQGKTYDLNLRIDEINEANTVVYTFATDIVRTVSVSGPTILFGVYGQNYTDTTLYVYVNGTSVGTFSTAPAGGSNYIPLGTVGFELDQSENNPPVLVSANSFVVGYITQ